MSWCATCEEYEYGTHECNPSFLVWSEDDSDESDATTVYAIDHECAAERWAEDDDCNSADYSIVSGNPATVSVRSIKDGSLMRFKVTGESEPVYSANELPAADGVES